jgi:hypothetical protein
MWRDDPETLRADLHTLSAMVTEIGEACLSLAREPDAAILERAASERAARESYQPMNRELVREVHDIRALCAHDVVVARAECDALRDQLLEAGLEPVVCDVDDGDKTKRTLASLRDELARVAEAAKRVVDATDPKRRREAAASLARRQRSVASPALASLWASLALLAERDEQGRHDPNERERSERSEREEKLRSVAENALRRVAEAEKDAVIARGVAAQLTEQYEEWLKSFDLERHRIAQTTRITAALAEHAAPLSSMERAAVRVARHLLDAAGPEMDPFGYMSQILLATCPLAVVRTSAGMQGPAASKLVRELSAGGNQCASYLGAVHILARHIGGDVAWSVTQMSCVHASAVGGSDPLFAAFGRARALRDPEPSDASDADLLSALVRTRLRAAARNAK